ncbi:MAG: transcriptional regulator [Planctomycetota bacterium]|jgi:DNA-binding PadR family transcriptional regulator
MKVAGLAKRIDPVIHERVRLGICSALASTGGQVFADLKRVLEVTDGNLYVHLRVLQEAEYVSEHKNTDQKRARTEYRITRKGRKAFRKYLDLLEGIVKANAGGNSDGASKKKK